MKHEYPVELRICMLLSPKEEDGQIGQRKPGTALKGPRMEETAIEASDRRAKEGK